MLFRFLMPALVFLASAAAKDKPLMAIVLYEAPSGPAWVQISDVMLNGKTEVAVCTPGSVMDNSAYRKLTKMKLVGAVSLEREAAGALSLATGSGLYCVVPTNLKLEKGSFAPRDLAGMAVLQGKVISKSNNGSDAVPAEFKVGTKLQFVDAPDPELAEFLRAQRWQTIALWREYLKLYPAAPHLQDARTALATLITGNAEVEMAAFTKSVNAHAPAYDHLKNARTQTQEALAVLPSFIRAQKLDFAIRAQLQEVVNAGRNELKAFQTAVADHTAGYEHINRAKSQVDDALRVDAAYDQALKLQSEVNQQIQGVAQATAQAESLVSARRFDDAYTAIQRYRAFAGELPKVAAVVDAAFAFHRDRGQEAVQTGKLDEAITEFRRALGYKDDAATADALKKTEADLLTLRNKDAAQKAVEQSQTLIASKQFVEAYELLDGLPEGPHAFVVEPLAALTHDYVGDAVKRADTLARVHIPIRGRADEDGARQAYRYLKKASQLADDEALKVKLDLVTDRISTYYLGVAKRLLEKPRGSGVGLGWLFLLEAQRFKTDLEAVKDQMTKYAPLYETRSRLSLAVRFRDQTSRRDSLGFADQLSDAMAANLEAAGIPGLKVLPRQERQIQDDSEAASTSKPNFELLGDILQHRVAKKQDVQRLSSHYRSGQREVKNPARLEANHVFQAMQDEYNRANDAFKAAAPAMKKKKDVEAATQQLEVLSRKVNEARKRMDAIPESLLQDIMLPYNYTKRILELSGIVELAFRVVDLSGAAREATNVKTELPKNFTLLENVKSEDVDGLQEEGTPPDEIQILADAESQAQGALSKKVIEKLRELPPRVLEDARRRVAEKDLEGAAESYILFLNMTRGSTGAERAEAEHFLLQEFNLSPG